MSTTWILVSNRSHARLLESIWPDKSLKRLKDIPHPQGQLKNSVSWVQFSRGASHQNYAAI